MSGECIKYASLKNPMSWDEFKALPNDLKKEYITSIRERFGAPDQYIAEMLGVSAGRFCLYVKDVGCAKGMGSGNKKWAKEEFYAWRAGVDENAAVPAVVEVKDESPTDSSYMSDDETECFSCEKVCAAPEYGKMLFNCPADQALNMLAMVLGDKRVRLSVEWDILEDTGATKEVC